MTRTGKQRKIVARADGGVALALYEGFNSGADYIATLGGNRDELRRHVLAGVYDRMRITFDMEAPNPLDAWAKIQRHTNSMLLTPEQRMAVELEAEAEAAPPPVPVPTQVVDPSDPFADLFVTDVSFSSVEPETTGLKKQLTTHVQWYAENLWQKPVKGLPHFPFYFPRVEHEGKMYLGFATFRSEIGGVSRQLAGAVLEGLIEASNNPYLVTDPLTKRVMAAILDRPSIRYWICLTECVTSRPFRAWLSEKGSTLNAPSGDRFRFDGVMDRSLPEGYRGSVSLARR